MSALGSHLGCLGLYRSLGYGSYVSYVNFEVYVEVFLYGYIHWTLVVVDNPSFFIDVAVEVVESYRKP
jgi:hypothetical protein